jgi:hypothetical protein
MGSLFDPSSFEGGVAVAVLGGLIVAATVAGAARFRKRRKEGTPLQAPSAPGPEPDLRILDFEPTGGGTYVDFHFNVGNYGTQLCRCEMKAFVGGKPVQCNPASVDLPPNSITPRHVQVYIPRPELGDLVKAFNDDTTLYGETLRVEVAAGEHKVSEEWHEHVYTLEENHQRHHIQQRVWRIARGEDTVDDRRQEYLEEVMRKREEEYGRGPDYDWNP